jgi:hypothetical protein
MPPKAYFLTVEAEDTEVLARLGAAVCLQWDALPEEARGILVSQASCVELPGPVPIGLRKIVDAFIASKKIAHAEEGTA